MDSAQPAPAVRVYIRRPPAHLVELATFRSKLTLPALTKCVESLVGAAEMAVQLRHAESCALVQTEEDLQRLVRSASFTRNDVRVMPCLATAPALRAAARSIVIGLFPDPPPCGNTQVSLVCWLTGTQSMMSDALSLLSLSSPSSCPALAQVQQSTQTRVRAETACSLPF